MSEERTYKKWSARDVKKCIAVPTDLDNKYSRGVLGVITGSAQYPGAAVLSTAAASATGVSYQQLDTDRSMLCVRAHGFYAALRVSITPITLLDIS